MPQETVLAVKVANADTEAGLFEGSDLIGTWKTVTRCPSTADELECATRAFIAARGLPSPTQSIFCSVVPSITDAWSGALASLTQSRPLVVGPGLKSGIAMKYKDPGQMGSDRVAVAVAARELFGPPAIAVDCGATTSLSVIDREGAFAGGAIAPGIGLSLDALSSADAQLSDVAAGLPKRVVGRTTSDAVRVGVVFGEAMRLDGLVEAMWDELGYETKVVLTGRFAPLVSASSRLPVSCRDDLALQGLRFIYELNRR